MKLSGRIESLNRGGIGFISDAGSPSNFVFSFDKIRRRNGFQYVPYRGEPLLSLGFKEGAMVTFEVDNGLVESVELK